MPGDRRLPLLWAAAGALLIAGATALALLSPRFGYDHAVRDMPVMEMTGILVLGGALYLGLPSLIRTSAQRSAGPTLLLLAMLACGLAVRLLLFASEPILEDDYQRYLWDGAVVAHGLNPYADTPEEAREADIATPLGALAAKAGPLMARIKYGDLTTIYPPIAQGAFGLAHLLSPWSLTAWRAVLLAIDLGVLALLLLLLRALGRSPLWSALYWWNPVAIKETVNSAHMEPVVLLPVLAGLLLALRGHLLLASASIAIATGAKLWPVLLFPLVWRPLLATPRRLAWAVAIGGGIVALLALPMLSAGLDQSAGLVAFATVWQTNSAHFPALTSAAAWLGADRDLANLAVRGLLAGVLISAVLAITRPPISDGNDMIARSAMIVGAMVLLSPAQYPWYYLWLLPLLALTPVSGLLVLTATLPLYYLRFHLYQTGQYELFLHGVVWLIWAPAWILLACDGRLRRHLAMRLGRRVAA